MTKISEMYSFNSISIKSYYKLPVIRGENSFFINVNRNSIVKIQERKLLHTWTLKHPHSFTCPVVFNKYDNTVCCVTNNDTLMFWPEEDDDLESSTKVKFKTSVFAILPVANESPLIIFTNGQCLPLDKAISGSKEPFGEVLKTDKKLIWCDASLTCSKYQVQYLTISEQNKQYEIHGFTLNKDDDLVENFIFQTILRKDCSLKDWCLNKYTKNCPFVAVWSDGKITSHDAKRGSLETHLLSVPVIQSNDYMSIDVIDQYHIALLRVDSAKSDYSLEIWDTQFATLECKKKLSVLPSSFFQMCILDNLAFFPSKDNLVAVPIEVEKSTLANATGKLASNPKSHIICAWTSAGRVVYGNCEISENNVVHDFNGTTTEQIVYDLVENIKYDQENILKNSKDLMNISESELIQALLLTLKLNARDIQNRHKQILLNILFCIPYSDVFLVKELRKISFSDILVILEILHSHLTNFASPVSNFCKPTDYQVANWIYLILQSHVEEILLSKDDNVIGLLEQLLNGVLQKIEEASVEEEILHLIKLIKKGKILPERTLQEKYSIEILMI